MEPRIINKRVFNKTDDKEIVIFDRANIENIEDIAASAALAMHKAIIGVCELSALEEAERQMNSSFRASKAIHCYYVIYHLFTCCMLLDDEYEIIFLAKKGKLNYGTRLEDLRREPVIPRHWNNRKWSEMGLAERITHGDIKEYCDGRRIKENGKLVTIKEGLRDRVNKCGRDGIPSYLLTLYDSFVKENCDLILFEKADYIRDRTIYRPSHVPSMTDTPIQTSKNIRLQYESLPDSVMLYNAICKIHHEICLNEDSLFYSYKVQFANSIVDCPTDYAQMLGYTWENLKNVGGNKDYESVPTFVCQLMELFSPEEVLKYYEKYWSRLLKDTISLTFYNS